MTKIRDEQAHSINGVPGRLFALNVPPAPWVAGVFANQTWKSEVRKVSGYGTGGEMQVSIRFDDNCKNGHMTFAMTADVYTNESRRRRDVAACGAMHEEIAKVFPELAPLIKWHLVSTDSPIHYVANTIYHAGDRDAARSAGVWPDATDEELSAPKIVLKAALEARLPALIAAFRADMENIGFMWEAPARA